ncbi:hypothetical protein KPH14_001861 [Odynerus spinipes]|uniref:TPX2 C-terminal domain-containing protein n=1 Tax=Odynerus spinipes TaxID=1348599 RepID=A0AAD9S0J0_9HYME|nr:hypothetical protein KPH14_001861 [Odynerus spinipes]
METRTPISYQIYKSRPTNRQLWPQNKIRDDWFQNWINHDNKTTDPWDNIESPQFINFFDDMPEISDKFFETKEEDKLLKHSAKAQTLPRTNDHNTLIELLDNFSLAKENKQPLEEKIIKDNEYQEKGQNLSKLCIETKHGITNEEKKNTSRKCHTIAKPFNFNLLNDKHRQERKDECIKNACTFTFNEDKKSRLFRAQPVPKFIKMSAPSKSGCTSRYMKSERLDSKNTNDKSLKNSTEIWKKAPFIPRPPKRMLKIPKTPPLLTASRAEERKEFEESLRRKEKEEEMLKSLAAIAEKKREKEEIIRLRKEIVHKAQPIRKYKSSLPHVEKRPLTEPLTPFNHKRRRCT